MPEVDPPCSKEDEEEETGKIGKQTQTLSERIVAMEESEVGGNNSAEEGPKWREARDKRGRSRAA